MLSLLWLEPALAELEATLGYIRYRNEAAAVRLQQAIEACAERLPEHPYLYRPGRVAGTREAVVHPNYILVYRVTFVRDRDHWRALRAPRISLINLPRRAARIS